MRIAIWVLVGVLFIQIVHSRNTVAGHVQQYDDTTRQRPVYSHAKLDSVLNRLELVPYKDLPKEYLDYTESVAQENVLSHRQYYRFQGVDVYQYIVGHFRIADLMSKDTFFIQNTHCLPEGCVQYWLIDTAVLHRFLDLVLWMRKSGYNDSAITINNGHRHPAYNKFKGGVPKSYHMQGMAIDIKVGDIDRNDTINAVDKQILLDELESHIIRDSGGLGLYPNTMVIHFDTRGYRARWNSH
jgi:hypothetical protein